ncbi:hypothetical protein D3C75_793770 [compost metagenome]
MKALAGCIQAQALALLGGQAKAHSLFQKLYLLADCASGNAQPLCRLGDTAAQTYGFKNFQCA